MPKSSRRANILIVSITEGEQLQADYLRDYMTVLFSHQKVMGILMWGFWDGEPYPSVSAIFRKDWSLKPDGMAWVDLAQHQ